MVAHTVLVLDNSLEVRRSLLRLGVASVERTVGWVNQLHMRYANTIEILKRLLSATREKKIVWTETDVEQGWFTATVGNEAYRPTRHGDGASRPFVMWTMTRW